MNYKLQCVDNNGKKNINIRITAKETFSINYSLDVNSD